MKRFIILSILLIFIAGCTPSEPPPEPCNGLEIPREFGSGCCSDLDANGICDDLEDEDSPVVEPEDPVVEPEDPVEEPIVDEPVEPEVNLSFTEEAATTFWTTARSMDYVLDTPEYGDIWIWLEEDGERYVTVEDLWENDQGVLAQSQYHYIQTNEVIINGIEDRNLPLLNYLESGEEGQYTGCYVEGRYLSLENCIDDYPNANPILHYNPSFTVPETPLDWLAKFDGREPSKINEDRTYRIKLGISRQVSVDEVFFNEDDGSSTKFYLHKKYRVPLQIDFLGEDGKVRDSLVFEGADFNGPVYDGAIRLDSEEFS